MDSRENVYKAIDIERDYQKSRWGNDIDTDLASFLLYIEKYNDATKKSYTNGNLEQTLSALRKIAALSVAALERHGLHVEYVASLERGV